MTKLDEVIARVKAIDKAEKSERIDNLKVTALMAFDVLDILLRKVLDASDEELTARKGAPTPTDYKNTFAGITDYGIELYSSFKHNSDHDSKERVTDLGIVATLVANSFMVKYPEYRFETSIKQTGGFFILVSPKPPSAEQQVRWWFKFIFNPFFRRKAYAECSKAKE